MTAAALLEELAALGVSHLVGIPDNQTAALVAAARRDPRFRLIGPCREGEVIAIAAGLYVGGRRPLVFIQNTGLLEAGDVLRVVAHNMRVPLVMLLGYRGFASLGTLRPDTAATLLEPTLTAWRIAWSWCKPGGFKAAYEHAERFRAPFALVYAGRIESAREVAEMKGDGSE